MSGLVLRDARRDEVTAIVRMLADDALGAARERLDDPQPYLAAFDRIAQDANNRLLVAEQDGELVGTLQLTVLHGLSRRGATRALIEAVRVAAPWRGKGVGRRMIEGAIEIARAEGCAMVQLTSDKSRSDAHRFYESLGFVASHEGMKLALR
ncbi:MAG: GNAT family N-acetyltransferase [Bradyrhizobiaceae bacterium]|nr:MAG: GNAT family N-acetyltransferase [Bradyrhizobiaceae bacterium]